MQALLAGGQWVNLLVLLATVLNNAYSVFPQLQTAHWFTVLQTILGIILPSLKVPVVAPQGISHALQGTQVIAAPKQ